MKRRWGKWPKKEPASPFALALLGCLALVHLLFLWFFPVGNNNSLGPKMLEAANEMARAVELIKDCRLEAGLPLDPSDDPNGTGLIGVRRSIITTTLGSLEAKRTSTNPNLAALMVYFFDRLHLQPGDGVAIGASASFPAALVATLAAVRVLKLKPLIIFSLGASQWGANIPQFTLAHIYQCLQRSNFVQEEPLAVTLGGERDAGLDMPSEGRDLLRRQIIATGWYSFREPNLAANVARRLSLYQEGAGSWEKIKVFVNIGGSYANLGTDARVLSLRPGLNRGAFSSFGNRGGVIQAMAARHIPIIHLLYFRGLAAEYGLDWDPLPLPPPGKSRLFRELRFRDKRFLWLNLIYLSLVFLGGVSQLIKNYRRYLITPR